LTGFTDSNRKVVSTQTPAGSLPDSNRGFIDDPAEQAEAILHLRDAWWLWRSEENISFCDTEQNPFRSNGHDAEFAGYLPPIHLNKLGDPTFTSDHGLRYPYMAGAMAHGIAGVDLVIAMSRAGMLGSYGAAGQPLEEIERSIHLLQRELGSKPFSMNLIHSPAEPTYELAVVDLYLTHKIRLVEASAYLDLTAAVVLYRIHGIHRDAQGRVVAPNQIIAKASRVEVATKWFSPPPEKLLNQLVLDGRIDAEAARLAAEIPMAQDLIAESDSGGHTDNRPALTLIPQMIALRDQHQTIYDDTIRLRVGAAGGIGTPTAAAAALAMGAAFVVTGSINQGSVEAATSDAVKQMLADARQADIAMAPAADMFEMGVQLQVLKRGTMFPMRAAKLYDFYRAHPSFTDIPSKDRERLETDYFRQTYDQVWQQTRDFFLTREPKQVHRAEADLKHQMALVFRWYLGSTSRWANAGVEDRRMDYQVWCGPAMGAFNAWAAGSFLEEACNRNAVTIGLNILYHAAVLQRVQYLQQIGLPWRMPAKAMAPKSMDQMETLC
jgi:trans-AT polyketide synthase/acyltransferase/oxidoreductase domain-containing protein